MSSTYWMTRFDIIGMGREEPAMNAEQHERLTEAIYETDINPVIKVENKHLMVSADSSVTYGTIEVPAQDENFRFSQEPVLLLKEEGIEPMRRVMASILE